MATPKEERIDFSAKTKLEIFKRVNTRCSVPRCKNVTLGPYVEHEGALNMGFACHIYSAAGDGPRGRGGQTEEFIRSEKNGIWCCSTHAGLVDKKKGIEFPAAVLFAWKALAEARARKLLDDTPSPLGWVDTIGFSEYGNLITPPRITLSRNTLIYGPNCSGKTSLMEAAASVSDSRYAVMFCGTSKGFHLKYKVQINYSTVDAHNKTLELEICNGSLIRREGRTPYLLPPGDLEVILCSERQTRRKPHEDDVDFLMRYLSIDKTALFYLAEMGGGELLPGDIKFEEAVDDDDDDDEEKIPKKKYKLDGEPYMNLLFRHRGGEFWVHLKYLSGSEYGLLLVSFAASKAHETCKQKLTLFLVDALIFNFDEFNFEKLLSMLSKSDFQSALILPPYQEENILEKSGASVELKKLAYLEQWQLKVLERSEYLNTQGSPMRSAK
ncbi:ATP-binding protein [Pseudomonas psychrophila]|uniref:ATP-binding protein n=1 Tax=Pseudomonas psychrophila TaxID=122355 RepID=UPI001969E529|nr:ATP-binding protein [Pseudomonas psychrophila]